MTQDIDLPNFVHSFARYMVDVATRRNPNLIISRTSPSIGFFEWETDQQQAADPHSVIYPIPGGERLAKESCYSFRCDTFGKTNVGAARRAQAMFRTLRDDDFRELRNVTIQGFIADTDSPDGVYRILAAEISQMPGQIGRVNEWKVMTFVFNLRFFRPQTDGR